MGIVAERHDPSRAIENMASSFVLVGGMMYAAKHWSLSRPLLEECGHEVISVELPGLGEDTSDPLNATIESHIAAIVSAVDSAKNVPVILVGHSLAGVTISAAAEQRSEKIKKLVFVAAETRPGAGWMETATNPGPTWLQEGLLAPLDGGLMGISDGKVQRIAEIFFSGASQDDISAFGDFLRPQPPPYNEEALLLGDNYNQIPKAYIKTLQDEVNLPIHQDTWIERLGEGVVVIELETGHSPFISTPKQFADALKSLVV